MFLLRGGKLRLQSIHRGGIGLLQRIESKLAFAALAFLALATIPRLGFHAGQRFGARLRLLGDRSLLFALCGGGTTAFLVSTLLAHALALGTRLHQTIAPRRDFLREALHLRRIRALAHHALHALVQQAIEGGVHHVAPGAAVQLEFKRRHTHAWGERLQSADGVVLVAAHQVAELGRGVHGQPRPVEQFADRQDGGVLVGIHRATRAESS